MINTEEKPFLQDIAELRRRTREQIEEGSLTPNYGGNAQETIALLQNALATEAVCVLRYTMHSISATGIFSEGIKQEFQTHAREEQEHLLLLAERINQLGGKPDLNPESLTARSASEYGNADKLVDMIKENLIAERIAVEHYRDLIRYFKDKDPTTRVMLESILATEEEHANDMRDLLVAHQGQPFIEN